MVLIKMAQNRFKEEEIFALFTQKYKSLPSKSELARHNKNQKMNA